MRSEEEGDHHTCPGFFRFFGAPVASWKFSKYCMIVFDLLAEQCNVVGQMLYAAPRREHFVPLEHDVARVHKKNSGAKSQ